MFACVLTSTGALTWNVPTAAACENARQQKIQGPGVLLRIPSLRNA